MKVKTTTRFVTAATPPMDTAPRALSALDRANLWLILRGTWVFDEELDPDRLATGLAELLVHYPHLAGRMSRGQSIEPNNAGVPFSVVERPDLEVADVCSRPELASDMSNHLDKGRVKRGIEAPLTIRLTYLRDGSVLGVRCTHACLDGRAFYSMVRNWSCACAGRPFPLPHLEQNILAARPGRTKEQVKSAALAAGWSPVSLVRMIGILPNLTSGRLLHRTPSIRLAAPALSLLRSSTREASGCCDLSTYEALSAFLAASLPKLFGVRSGTPCEQVHVVDVRERIEELDVDFAGNAAFVVLGARFAAGASIGEIAAQSHQRLRPYLSRPSKALREEVLLGVEIMEHRLLMLPYDVVAMHCRRPTLSYINSFAHMPVYEVDFGTLEHPLTPVRVLPHDLPDPYLIWPAPPSQGGLELYLTGVAARSAKRQGHRGPWWEALASLF